MSEGFSQENIDVSINKNEVQKILKKYKKIKKYTRSSIFEIKTMDGTENYVSKLIEEGQE